MIALFYAQSVGRSLPETSEKKPTVVKSDSEPAALVVVVTGASSGIGRATAEALADRGDKVVMAGRSLEALEAVGLNADQAMLFAADVSVDHEMRALAAAAVDRFGRIDAWINNAGVFQVGPFETVPDTSFRRVVEVNFFGCVNGSRAALPQFRRQGHGVLVNIASVLGAIPGPGLSAYSSSKHAIRAFTASLRQELAAEGSSISVCTVLPATMDTPLYASSSAYGSVSAAPIPPVYGVTTAARAIVSLIDRPRAEIVIGRSVIPVLLAHGVLRHPIERLFGRWVSAIQARGKAWPAGPGNLFQPSASSARSGGWSHGPVSLLRFLRKPRVQ